MSFIQRKQTVANSKAEMFGSSSRRSSTIRPAQLIATSLVEDSKPKHSLVPGKEEKFSDQCCVLNPTNRCHIAWDLLLVLVIIWNVTADFYYSSFVARHDSRRCAAACFLDDTSHGEGAEYCDSCDSLGEYQFFTWISTLADAVFVADVVVNFRTALIVTIRGQKVFIKDLSVVSATYLRGFFIVDLLGIGIPALLFDLMTSSLSLEENGDEIIETFFAIAYVAGTLKILRLVRLNALVKRLYVGTVEFQNYFMLIKLGAGLLLASHLFGCLFWGLFTRSDGTPIERNSWMESNNLHNADDPIDQYVPTVYFALMTITSIGYGDITPNTTAEMGFVICVIVMGAILYALLLAMLTSMLSKFVSASQPLNDAMEQLDVFLDITEADEELRREVMETLQYQWRLSNSFDVSETISDLPSALRRLILEHLHRPMLIKTPFLAHADDVFVGALAQILRMQVCLPGTHIYSTGDLAEDMHFIHEGTVLIMAYNRPQVQFQVASFMRDANSDKPLSQLKRQETKPNAFVCLEKLGPGDYFGEHGILLRKSRRVFHACGATHCELFSVRSVFCFPCFGYALQSQ